MKDVYRISADFPKEERFGLTSQMRRCAASMPANIAEGFARIHKKEFRQFLYISLGSSFELWTYMVLASDMELVSQQIKEELISKLTKFSKMVISLIKKIG